MHGFAALMMSSVIAASAPAVQESLRPVDGALVDVGEAYVAELDADWNVSRDIRVPCSLDSGCAVDLGLCDPGLAAVHVRFDPMRAGKVEVTSRLEDRAGRASAAQDDILALDRTGFGASHYEARMPSGAEGRVIVMAVRVPGWTAPAQLGSAARQDRT